MSERSGAGRRADASGSVGWRPACLAEAGPLGVRQPEEGRSVDVTKVRNDSFGDV